MDNSGFMSARLPISDQSLAQSANFKKQLDQIRNPSKPFGSSNFKSNQIPLDPKQPQFRHSIPNLGVIQEKGASYQNDQNSPP